jgi:hypothetical protein
MADGKNVNWNKGIPHPIDLPGPELPDPLEYIDTAITGTSGGGHEFTIISNSSFKMNWTMGLEMNLKLG